MNGLFLLRIGRKRMMTLGLFLVLLLTATPVLAGGGPSPENCEEKGMIDVECIVCDTGEYRGKVSVQAEYDPDYDDCLKRYREARRLCISTYGLSDDNAGCTWSYSMGGNRYTGVFPDFCKE